MDEKKRRKETIKRDFFNSATRHNRYRLLSVIGEGAYGVVCSAQDADTGRKVAIKRIKSILSSKAMAVRILREIKFLRLLKGHENIIKVLDVLVPANKNFDDTFVVFELMPTDLHRLLRSRTELQKTHVKYFMFQLLRAVAYLHSAKVFHRDLKPNNILINSKCELRLCDFGLARAAFENHEDMVFWTDYVATRWYRAPELIMAHFTSYSTAIDVWSVGCIFAEMLSGGNPLFPGVNALHQFELITQVTGRPTPQAIDKLRNAQARDFVRSLPVQPKRSLETIFKDADPLALDLLKKLLEFDPDARISAAQAIDHAYFSEYRHLGEGVITDALPAEEFAFERARMTEDQMREEFLKEIALYHPDVLGVGSGAYRISQGEAMADAMDTDTPDRRTLPSETMEGLSAPRRFKENATIGEEELQRHSGPRNDW